MLRADITTLDAEIKALLARTEGQVLTTLPGQTPGIGLARTCRGADLERRHDVDGRWL